jgi:hypothetical protein
VESCKCITTAQGLVLRDLFPTRCPQIAIDIRLLELFRRLNVRSALAIKSFTDILEGIHYCEIEEGGLKIMKVEYEKRRDGFYDLFSDSFYAYRSLMLRLEQANIGWECPACPRVCTIFMGYMNDLMSHFND